MKKYTLPVKGMNCASCSITVEKTLKKQPGVIECEVNFGNEKANITLDESKTDLPTLSKTIEPFGYSLDIEIHNQEGGNHNREHRHVNHDAHKSGTHVMPDGTVMDNNAMDHSQHLGLNQTKDEKLQQLEKERQKVLFALPAALFMFGLMMWEISAMYIPQIPVFPIDMMIYQRVALILATVSLFWIGGEFLKEVLVFLRYRVANMYTLIGIGTFTAYVYSAFVVLFPDIAMQLSLPENAYFDVTIIVIGFVYFGKYLETRSKLKTGEAIEKLINLQAKTATILRDGQEREIAIEDVVPGDLLVVKPGQKIPVDGVITEGTSSIDESMITGEPIPIDKTPGEIVIGGSINKHGSFTFKATKVGADTLLAGIIRMVDEAQGSRAPIQKVADKVSEVFVPVVLVVAILSLAAWIIAGFTVMPFDQALSLGLMSFVGVLIIACPCALGLATPTAIIVGTGKGAEIGILIKNAESLEKLHSVTTIVTDKTGTLTEGKPVVTDIIVLSENMTEKEMLQILGSLEKKSEHPIAHAIVEKMTRENYASLEVTDFSILEGMGLTGKVKDTHYFAGNLKLMEKQRITVNSERYKQLTDHGKTLIFLADSKTALAVIGITDTVKDTAKETIQSLHKLGIKVVMLTGDSQKAADFFANETGIDTVVADVLPGEKAAVVKKLQEKGEIVAMVGDGVNDAPALAQADVGIAMGTGTDVAIESAQITLLKGDFSKVLKAIKLSKFTMTTIKQNLFWAFAYNIVGIPFAAGLFYPFFGVTLNPAFAGMAMALSSVSVIGNSLRLRGKRL